VVELVEQRIYDCRATGLSVFEVGRANEFTEDNILSYLLVLKYSYNKGILYNRVNGGSFAIASI